MQGETRVRDSLGRVGYSQGVEELNLGPINTNPSRARCHIVETIFRGISRPLQHSSVWLLGTFSFPMISLVQLSQRFYTSALD